MLAGCDNYVYEQNSDWNKCDNLIKEKGDILINYVWYYWWMLSGTQNINMDDSTYKYIIEDLWDHQLSFSKKYLFTMVGVSDGYNPMEKWSLDAPSFCSNNQAYRIKKYDDMYVKFYNCVINNEISKDYFDVNLLECSSNLAEAYFGEVMNNYYSDKS